MTGSITSTAELISELRQLDAADIHMGAANWIVESIADRDEDFDSIDDFVDWWMETPDLPDDQMGWILSNAFGPDWETPLIERLGHATETGDATETPQLLEHLRVAGEQAGQDLVILGAFGGGAPPRRDLIDLFPPAMPPGPEYPRGTPDAWPSARPDELDPRRFQVSRDPDEARVVQFEFSERDDLENLPVAGDDQLLADLIPDAGLLTRWVVSSAQRLTSVDPETMVYPFEGDGVERWVAEFELLIPKFGDSDVRRLRCDGDERQHLDIRIYSVGINTDLLRQLMVSLGPGDGGEPEVDDDDAVADISDSIDPPPTSSPPHPTSSR